AVAFSVWVEGRPVEELAYQVCIAPTEDVGRTRCPGRRAMVYTLRGVDSLRLAAEGGGAPDGALHVIQMHKSGNPHGQIMGVFWRKKADREEFLPVTWRLNRSPEGLADYLVKTVMPQFFQSGDAGALQDAGRGLYNTLFPDNDAWSDTVAARKAFEAFL